MNNQSIALAFGTQPQLDTMGITMSKLIDEEKLSASYVDQYTRDFPELDRIVDGIPINHDPSNPFVGDTTLAGLVRSIPKSSLQQLPQVAFQVNGTKYSIPALLCTYLAKQYAFNEDTFGKGLLSTLQVGTEQALAHGYAAFMVATGVMFNDFGTTMKLLHYTDTSPEPGIQDHNETGYDYVTANLTPSRVDRIIRAAENNPSTTWNIPALKQLRQQNPRPTSYSQHESPARQNTGGENAGPTYKFKTRYETGTDATIITFSPEMTEAPLRVMESRSKWGYPRVMYLVIDPAALTPFGVSRVRLASPNANLLNIYYANIASMLLLNSRPPLFKKGRFLKPVQLKQGQVWESLDPQAEVTLKTLDNGALQSFGNMQQSLSGQIQNIMGNPTPLPSGDNANFSKTGPGVKLQQSVMDVSTNQITKLLENFLRQYALVALDTLLSEQEGVEQIIVDDDTKNAINTLAEQQFVPEIDELGNATVYTPVIGDDNKIEMNWTEFYDAIEQWSAEITVSLSKDELEDKKRGDIQDMLTVLAQNADTIPGAAEKVQELTDMLQQDLTPLVKPLPPSSAMPAPMSMPTPPALVQPEAPQA